MFIFRDMDGELNVSVDRPTWNEESKCYDFSDETICIPLNLYWIDLQPGDCRQLVLGDYLFEGGVSVSSQK